MSDGNNPAAATESQTQPHDNHVPNGPVAVVLAGAGARGAYEAGFIATLLPHLRPRPTIFVGTSAGAINAALLASVAHLEPDAAGDAIMKSWSALQKKHIFRPFWRSVPRALAQYALALVSKREPPQSLLDVTPLAASLANPALLDWKHIASNLENGALDVLAFAATETGSGRTKVFYQTKPTWSVSSGSVLSKSGGTAIKTDESQAIDYVATTLGESHVRASAAIPLLFPAVRLKNGRRESFFVDGGLRLNAPLKPALQFGADGLVVVSTDPRHFESSLAIEPKPPTLQGHILQILRALFADRMIEDIRTLLNRNRAAKHCQDQSAEPSGDRVVPIIFGGPIDQDRLGGVAARALKECLRGAPLLRLFGNVDIALLDQITSVSSTSGPDLISYIFFEPQFLKLALRAGIQDASAMLNDYPNPNDLWSALEARDRRRISARQQSATAPVSGTPPA